MQARALVVSALCFLPSPLLAQDTPFRAGQWAAQFAGGLSTSLGVIKFRSSTSAWVLDLRINATHGETFDNGSVTFVTSQGLADLRIGRRTYRAVGDKVVAHHSRGLSLGFTHNITTSPFLGRSSSNGVQAGPFLDVGASYLVTPHLGIGANGQGAVVYARAWGESPTGGKSKQWSISGGMGVSFLVTVYF